MKEKLANIRSIVEKLSESHEDEEMFEALNEDLESLEVLASHIDSYDGYDLESWAEELRQLVDEMDE